LSYIVAVLVMILVTSSLAATLLMWGMNAIGVGQARFTSAVNARDARYREIVAIEDVRFESSSLTVHIRNGGISPLVVDKIYVNHTLTDSPRLTLGSGGTGSLTAKPPFTLTVNDTYLIRVVTAHGATASGYYKWVE